mmetsp:Transcript_142917/g.456615  ORF Transcript_142917/g.456615 Transcript_142917/m.456615 type:complete len:178 (+) Transcript_142917:80-613(+)
MVQLRWPMCWGGLVITLLCSSWPPMLLSLQTMCDVVLAQANGICLDELYGLKLDRRQYSAVCNFCWAMQQSLEASQEFRAGDARMIDLLSNLRYTFYELRRVEPCSEAIDLKLCGFAAAGLEHGPRRAPRGSLSLRVVDHRAGLGRQRMPWRRQTTLSLTLPWVSLLECAADGQGRL